MMVAMRSDEETFDDLPVSDEFNTGFLDFDSKHNTVFDLSDDAHLIHAPDAAGGALRVESAGYDDDDDAADGDSADGGAYGAPDAADDAAPDDGDFHDDKRARGRRSRPWRLAPDGDGAADGASDGGGAPAARGAARPRGASQRRAQKRKPRKALKPASPDKRRAGRNLSLSEARWLAERAAAPDRLPLDRPTGISIASGSSTGWRIRVSGAQLGHYATAYEAWEAYDARAGKPAAAPADRRRDGPGATDAPWKAAVVSDDGAHASLQKSPATVTPDFRYAAAELAHRGQPPELCLSAPEPLWSEPRADVSRSRGWGRPDAVEF
ncbi:hypothetical protein M885DRAFT_552594 [Pelagophyceae sp. CCMP2097]|nr:hypothetical protein M885DRAFT_552594 [Pelagophyceae sp. CCMP2097]